MKRGVVDPPLGVAKSAGTDDGFHGIGAACGHSVVAVAHQMIAGGRLRPHIESVQVGRKLMCMSQINAFVYCNSLLLLLQIF